jgi:hypothetical protein
MLVLISSTILLMVLSSQENNNITEKHEYEFSWNGYSEADIKYAMKYHGIISATFCSPEGEPYFYRDGKKINLFTEDVKKRLNK